MDNRNVLFTDYLTKHLSHVSDPHLFRHRRKDHFAYNYLSLLPSSKEAKILEIGPGFGELLELLHAQGYKQAKAIDISEEVVEFCNHFVPNTTELVEDSTEFLRKHQNHFDCIFLFHVLEHVRKPDIPVLLEAIQDALVQDGRLIVEVPNMANPFIGLNFRYADFTHEIGFTETSLQYVLQSVGFREVKIFGPRILRDRPIRLLQNAIRVLVDGLVTLIYRAYASRRPKVISPVLSAVAIK